MQNKMSLGFIPSPPDNRDYLLSSFLPPLEVSLPEEWLEWQKWQTPVKSQGSVPACVGFAACGQKECYDYKELNKPPDLSEQFLYGKCKETDGLPNAEGTFPRAALQILKNIGVCEESYFPYEGRYPPNGKPKAGYLENAAQYKLSTYAAVNTNVDFMKQALYQNGPILTGIKVYENFYNVGKNGIIPAPSGRLAGGHAILITAYDKTGFIFKNSWGTQTWGNAGYGLMPYNVWKSLNYGEAWSIVDVIKAKKPWTDWPDSEIELGWLTKNSGVLQGYPDGSFKPYNNVTMHQAIVIAKRLGFSTPRDKTEYWSTPALRGWIMDTWPQYTFLEERRNEPITRYQFALIIGRFLKTK